MTSANETWFVQLAEMKEAVEGFRSSFSDTPEYDMAGLLDYEDLSTTGCSESIFDEICGFDVDSYSDLFIDEDESRHDGESFGREWLTYQCIEYCLRREGTALGPGDLESNLLAILSSDMNNDELQSSLTDILGYEDFDLVGDLISHRDSIVKSCESEKKFRVEKHDGLGNGTKLRLMTREQREEALRLQDLEHKSKPLGPKFAEPSRNYPHIYRSHQAGNTLSSSGKKYNLPEGSREVPHDKYKEIIIPAAKVGIRSSKEKPVLVSEMDMLCQKTFKDYKSLNRMQSLLYEVAYKTNENMLICAPTGAVSKYLWDCLYNPSS